MKLLLDTHAAIWWLSDDARLGASATEQLGNDSNHVLLSAVVVWEAAIKRALGKLDVPADLATTLLAAGVHPLPIELDHAAAAGELPDHHRDPFDRMLVAQAVIEGSTLVSADEAMHAYDVPILWQSPRAPRAAPSTPASRRRPSDEEFPVSRRDRSRLGARSS